MTIPVTGDADRRTVTLLEELGPMDAWVLTTYAGCDIRCRYCIVSAQGRSIPRCPPDEVAERLRAELDRFASPPRLGVGAFTDVYPNVEERVGVTRRALEVLSERQLAYTLVTKGATVQRDVDLFAHRRGVAVQISLCSLDEDVLGRLDPGAPSGVERLSIVHALLDAGVRVHVQASPWIPGVTDLLALLDRLDPRIPVTTTPLRVPDHIRRTRFGRVYDQRTINAAFRREYERIGEVPRRLFWSRPPAEDGSPPHISDNLGVLRVTDWTPAPTAPNPGPSIDEMRRAWMLAPVELPAPARREATRR
jgi:hypothetical protein